MITELEMRLIQMQNPFQPCCSFRLRVCNFRVVSAKGCCVEKCSKILSEFERKLKHEFQRFKKFYNHN